VLFVILLLFAAEFARRRRVRRPLRSAAAPNLPADSIPAELRALFNKVDDLWARQGMARPATRAPLEHLMSIPPDKFSPPVREASGKIVDCFYRCCFGGFPILPAEIEGLRKELERARTPQ